MAKRKQVGDVPPLEVREVADPVGAKQFVDLARGDLRWLHRLVVKSFGNGMRVSCGIRRQLGKFWFPHDCARFRPCS
ncbi:hypothetical protein GCM10010172_51620 [Paractinoplanes ferrugineus]|uniref:Uncharacterized protein n=1 Tax=Paractinoplanes ferrugineus TaxID=113564 RepID=A0A919MES9_9ACTN|nr:hypothetical protein Afe05nite_38590 [Actinoplanes ferrugineus]